MEKGCPNQTQAWDYLKKYYPKIEVKSVRELQRYLEKEGSTWRNIKKLRKNLPGETEIEIPKQTPDGKKVRKSKKKGIDFTNIGPEDLTITLVKEYIVKGLKDEIEPNIGLLQMTVRVIELEKSWNTGNELVKEETLKEIKDIVKHLPKPPGRTKSEGPPNSSGLN